MVRRSGASQREATQKAGAPGTSRHEQPQQPETAISTSDQRQAPAAAVRVSHQPSASAINPGGDQPLPYEDIPERCAPLREARLLTCGDLSTRSRTLSLKMTISRVEFAQPSDPDLESHETVGGTFMPRDHSHHPRAVRQRPAYKLQSHSLQERHSTKTDILPAARRPLSNAMSVMKSASICVICGQSALPAMKSVFIRVIRVPFAMAAMSSVSIRVICGLSAMVRRSGASHREATQKAGLAGRHGLDRPQQPATATRISEQRQDPAAVDSYQLTTTSDRIRAGVSPAFRGR